MRAPARCWLIVASVDVRLGSKADVRPQDYTSRLRSTAAAIKLLNSGCGSKGRDFSSGWNWTPMNQGWSGYSTVSGKSPSGERPVVITPLDEELLLPRTRGSVPASASQVRPRREASSGHCSSPASRARTG